MLGCQGNRVLVRERIDELLEEAAQERLVKGSSRSAAEGQPRSAAEACSRSAAEARPRRLVLRVLGRALVAVGAAIGGPGTLPEPRQRSTSADERGFRSLVGPASLGGERPRADRRAPVRPACGGCEQGVPKAA